MTSAHLAQAKDMMSDSVDPTKMYVDMDQSKAYAEHRPRYTDELFKTIVDYCKETNPNLNLALDVGCGPGMSTVGFAKYFKKVMGVDVSETQIACAPKDIPNCEFKVGYSDKLPFIESESVDLFCAGESFNMLPEKETLAEADRVLRPGGTLAVFGYDMPTTEHPDIDAFFQQMWMKILPYMPKEALQIFEKSVELPYPGWIRDDSLKMAVRGTTDQYIGMMKSTSPILAYCRDHPDEDFIGDNARRLEEVLERIGFTSKEYNMQYNLFIVMGRKPKN